MKENNQLGHWKLWLKERENNGEGEEYIPVILHIGMEKTGSKAIQTWLAEERQSLAEMGWHVPQTLGAINHRQVSFLGYNKKRRDDGTQRRGIKTSNDLKKYQTEVFKRLRQEVKTATRCKKDAMIISTELATSRLTRVREIKRMIRSMQKAGCNPILVTLFRRDPVELLESRYSTAVLHEGWSQWNPPKAGSREANLFGDQIGLQKRWWSVIEKIESVDFDVYTYKAEVLIEGSSAASVACFMGCDKKMIKKAIEMKKNRPLPLLNLRALMIANMLERQKNKGIKSLGKYLRRLALKVMLGNLKYKVPVSVKLEYTQRYKNSKLENRTGWLIWSSWRTIDPFLH
ncbi:hypothetical protein [Synechococcus sp. MU1611]|uniref:hypothetical protein n=1 Tax=Synechococcus sp. MU1611 TaxID=2508345 RepID=UPI001CF81173|nr:hypothetical protein [Synechococcus sp. MU1611]MCB4411506.1 hypothetical protein [Synechococcus sp. MU1611]